MKIEFYELPDGSRPAMEFIQSLDPKMEAKMIHTIDMLEEHGGALREPYSRPLGEGIFELRAQVGNNISRVLYFFFVGNSAVLTHGFIKKRQKTPPREIERAKRYRNDYESKEGR
ncbi:MAG: type II toxin-antitoxin system RelE/ParE family toxin [Clostridiales bacterium]|nr:type II toxin-antitoxin system RelE/ParE family toxin [Clostridiales bacterium]